MLVNSLLFAVYAYVLAFALSLLTAGMIKVIQLATRDRGDHGGAAASESGQNL